MKGKLCVLGPDLNYYWNLPWQSIKIDITTKYLFEFFYDTLR